MRAIQSSTGAETTLSRSRSETFGLTFFSKGESLPPLWMRMSYFVGVIVAVALRIHRYDEPCMCLYL